MEDLAVDQEPDVRDPGDVGVDLGVQFPVHRDLEAGRRHSVAVAHDVHPAPQPFQLGGHRLVRPHLERGVGVERRAHPFRHEVVGVLVRDEDGGGAVQRARLGEGTRVDDEPALAVTEDDAGVAVLGQLHDPHPAPASGNPLTPPSGGGDMPGP
jgi:hypothetical protein